MQRTKLDDYVPWILIGLVLLSTVFSQVFFQGQSLRLDEAQSLFQTSHSILGIFKLVAQDVHVPLYHILLHGWQLLLGSDVAVARLLSFFFFLLALPMMYAVGRLCYDTKTALFATILLSISPFMNWYGNEIRMYSLFVFLVLLNQYFFIKIFKQNTTSAWWGFAISAFFGMYTHYFFFLILFTNLLFFLYNRRYFAPQSLGKFFLVAGNLFILFSPWLLYVIYLGSLGSTAPLLESPTTVNVFNTFSQFIFGFQTDHLNTILVSLWPLTILLAFMALRKNRRVTPETVYFLLVFLLPNIIAFVVSIYYRPIYLTRYLIFTMPPMYLIISWILSLYPKKLAAVARGLLIGAMLCTLLIEAVSVTTPVKENYRDATAYLSQNARVADVIVVSSPFTIYPVYYYYSGPTTVMTLPIWDTRKFGPIPPYSEEQLPKDLETIKANHDNLWLLLSYDQGYEEKLRIYMDTHLERTFSRQFSPGLTLYEYKLRYDH